MKKLINKKFKVVCFIIAVLMMMSVSSVTASDLNRDRFGNAIISEISVASPDGLIVGEPIYDKTEDTFGGFAIPISDEESRVAVPRKGISGELIGYELTISDKESLLVVPRKGCGINERVEITFSNGKELSINLHYDENAKLIPLTIPLFSDEGLPYSAEEIYAVLSELEGCGRPVAFFGTMYQGGLCAHFPAGVSNCLSQVYTELYSCNPSCHPGSYCGYVYRCNSGHPVDQGGKIYGVCE